MRLFEVKDKALYLKQEKKSLKGCDVIMKVKFHIAYIFVGSFCRVRLTRPNQLFFSDVCKEKFNNGVVL